MRQSKHHEVEIIICDQCGGKGFKDISDLVDYHQGVCGGYSHKAVKCNECEGSGRMKKTLSITIEPWKPDHKAGDTWIDD